MFKNKYIIRSSKNYLATIYPMKVHVLFNISSLGQIWLLSNKPQSGYLDHNITIS